jgi:hypothetical protein
VFYFVDIRGLEALVHCVRVELAVSLLRSNFYFDSSLGVIGYTDIHQLYYISILYVCYLYMFIDCL